jgi:hypothetical protein
MEDPDMYDTSDSYIVIADADEQVQDHCRNNERKKSDYMQKVTFGPFVSKEAAEKWADEYVLGYYDISMIIYPDNVIDYETTEPKYECDSCKQKLYVRGSCRCEG